MNENILRKTANGVYSNYCDSRKFKQHELFSDTTKISLRIQLFYDGVGTTNPLRGHATIHSVGVFYIIFENLHDKYSCNFSKVHLVAMVNSLDLKTYGFDTILTKITEDIKILETSGVSVEVKGKGTMQIFGSISQFCCDSLATNEIFGLVENFSTTDNCCSICYGTTRKKCAFFGIIVPPA